MKDASIPSRKFPPGHRITSQFRLNLIGWIFVTALLSWWTTHRFAQESSGLDLFIKKEFPLEPRSLLLDGLKVSAKGELEIAEKPMSGSIFHSSGLQSSGSDGSGVMFFSGKGSRVPIPMGSLRDLGRSQLQEDLTIYLRIQPSSQKEILQILTKTIFRAGMEYGLDLVSRDRILELRLHRFFQTAGGKRISETISSRDPLLKRDWNLITIHFQPVEKEVVLYLNGKEVGRSTGLPEDVVAMGFHPDDNTDMILGQDFYGEMREFEITRGKPNFDEWGIHFDSAHYNPDSKVVSHKLGIGLSPVYKADYSYSSFLTAKEVSTVPEGGLLEVWVRYHLDSFSAQVDENIPGFQWQRWEDVLRKPKCGESDSVSRENCFRYFQMKYILKSDPKGLQSPSLKQFTKVVNQTRPPAQVTGLKWNQKDSDLRNLKVCLSWIANDESNVWQGGRYTIHYGFRPGEISGKLVFRNPQKNRNTSQERSNVKEVEPSRSTRLSILATCIDNELIRKESEMYPYEKNLPYLRHGTSVYFQVSAENRFFSESGAGSDQSGKLSKPIVVSLPTKDP